MKSKTLTLLTAAVLFAALALPVRLPGQKGAKNSIRYKVIDLGTFGGPNSGNNGESIVMNSAGDVTGFADTLIPDPTSPAFCVSPDCLVSHAYEWRNGVLTDLSAIVPGWSSATNAINSQDQVVGQSEDGLMNPVAGIPEIVAAVWQDGRVIDLGSFGGGFSLATMNNNRGQVVGCAFNDIPDPFPPATMNAFYGVGIEPRQLRAFRWEGKQLQDLGTLGGADACAVWVSDRGQIAGASFTNSIVNPATGLPTIAPFLWEHGRMRDLGTLGGTVGRAFMTNESGQVIGQSSLAESPGACITGDSLTSGCHAFVWDRGVLTDLGTFGGNFSVPNWINEGGEIVGVASNQNEQTVFAFVWKKGVMTNLGTLPGDCASQAFAINSAGQVAGQSDPCDSSPVRAVLWEDGQAINLNVFVPPGSGLQLSDPKIINDAGNIVLVGSLPNGDVHSVVLIRCEEGSTEAEGCVDAGSDASTAHVNAAARASATQANLTPSEKKDRIRAFLAKHSRRFGSLPQK